MMSHFKGPDIEEALPDFKRNTSVLDLLLEKLCKNGDIPAMVEGQTGKTATFKELLQKGSSIAAGLCSSGVSTGDYVIMCCDKSITAYSILLGVMFTGATVVMYPIPHIDILPKLTENFTIKAVFCDVQYLERLRKSMNLLNPQPSLVVTTDPLDEGLTSLLQNKNTFKPYKVKDVKKQTSVIFFSSGTTGVPKGVQITDLNLQICGYSFNIGETMLLASPMFWMSALTAFLSSIFCKFTIVWSNSNEPKDNLRLLQKYNVEGWFTGTGTLSRYVNEPTLSMYDLSSVKKVLIGGEYVVSSIYKKFFNKVLKGRAEVTNGYGCTEGGLIASMKPGQQFEIGCCGILFAGVEIKILDDNRKLVPVGKLGNVWLKTPALTVGYWGKPDLNKESFDQEGFLGTSDVGFFDEKGNIHLRGRAGDLIDFKGTKISPAEVEDILMSHESVLDVAVVGKHHSVDNQHLTAYVVLNPGCNVKENVLQKFVDEKVSDEMMLRGGVHFLDILPRTIIGKVQRSMLREL